MERRTAVIAASAISATVLAAGGVMAVAAGVFEQPERAGPEPIASDQPIAQTSTSTTSPEVVTVVVDEPVGRGLAGGVPQGATVQPAAAAAGPAPAVVQPAPPAAAVASHDDHPHGDDSDGRLDDDHDFDDDDDDDFDDRDSDDDDSDDDLDDRDGDDSDDDDRDDDDRDDD